MAYGRRRQGSYRPTTYRRRAAPARRRSSARRRSTGRAQRIVIQVVGPHVGPGAPSPLTLGKMGNLPLRAKY